jgi:hypothetical protein
MPLFDIYIFVSICFLCASSFCMSSLSSSLCKLAHIFIYFYCPFFIFTNPSFQNIFINLLSFQVSLMIQALKTFLFIYIVLSFLLIQAFRASSLIYCPFVLVDLGFHNNFFFPRVLSSLMIQAIRASLLIYCHLLPADPNFHNNFFPCPLLLANPSFQRNFILFVIF